MVRPRCLDHGQAGAPGVAALRPLWPLNVRVGENSPSLCPTMSSCTNTRRNLFPLWTSNVWPTNSGMIVHARAHVRMGCLDRFWFRICTLRNSFSSTYGPFFALRLMGFCSGAFYLLVRGRRRSEGGPSVRPLRGRTRCSRFGAAVGTCRTCVPQDQLLAVLPR